MVTITDSSAINFSVSAPITVFAQAAAFGAATPASSGGWRPLLATGYVENLVSYDGLVSGSLGSHAPSIAAGRLVFAGAAGGPNGAVVRCTGLSGRIYDVTISQVASRKDIATDADINAAVGVTANLGLSIFIRQNAQIGFRDRTVGGTEWLSATTQGECDAGIASPITLQGEGAFLAGEYHLHSLRSFFPSSTLIQRLKFADQKTKHSLLVESGTGRRNRNIMVKENYFKIEYDVDGAGNWTTGFSSTGFVESRLLFVTGGWTRDLTVMDNTFIGGHVSAEIAYNGTLIYVGNYHASPYFDYRKTSAPTNYQLLQSRLEGGNFYGDPLEYSVNEIPATAPHLDMDQTTGADGIVMMYEEARIVWHDNPVGVQSRFHNDRLDTYTGGYRWSIAGDMQLIYSPHIASNDYPDNLVMDRLFVLPNSLATLPIGGTDNRVLFGTSKPGNGGTIGAHRITNSAYSAIGYDVSGPTAGDVTETNVAKYSAEVGAYFAANLARWSDWGSLPVSPTYADALTYFAPVAASAFDGKSPQPHITAGSPLQSDYTITNTLRPVPTLSALTVTTASTAAFTVTTNIATNSTVHWAVFLAEVTDPAKIVVGINGGVAALALGINHRGNSAGSITGGGTASLGAGTYWLCVAQYNGPKKVHVATLQFTV